MYRAEIASVIAMICGIGVTGTSAAPPSILSPTTGISVGIGITVASSALFFGLRAGRLMERLKHLEDHLGTLSQIIKEQAGELSICKSNHRKKLEDLDRRLTVQETLNPNE